MMRSLRAGSGKAGADRRRPANIAARLASDPSGGVSLILGGLLGLGACLAAFAVDMGAIYLDGRRLQGVADAAALAAAGDPDQAETRARATITASGWARAALVGVETGSYTRDRTLAPDARFAAGGVRRDAARARVSATVPLYFAAMFGHDSLVLTRRATAARAPVAAFSIGSRVAASPTRSPRRCWAGRSRCRLRTIARWPTPASTCSRPPTHCVPGWR